MFWGAVACAAERLTVEKAKVNVRSGPGTNYEMLWEAEANYPVTVVERKGKWVRFRDFEGYEGWIYGSLLGRTPSVVVKKGKCNVRSGPGKQHALIFTAEKGVPFRVLGRKGSWIRIRHADGDSGWIHKSLVW